MRKQFSSCPNLPGNLNFWTFQCSYFSAMEAQFQLGLAAVFDFFIFPLAETVNSSILQYNLESLTRKTSYTVQVMASTSAGGTNSTQINFRTLSISEYFLQALRASPCHLPQTSQRCCLLKAGGSQRKKGHLLSGSLTFLEGLWVRRE